MLKVSSARSNINPTFPCSMEGYHEKRFSLFQKDANGNDIDPMRTSYGVRDDLVMDTLYLEINGKALVIHIPDVVIIEQSLGDRAKKELSETFNMSPDQFIITCSHTHSSPLVSTGIEGNRHPNPAYLDLLVEKMIQNTKACIENAKEATATLDAHAISDGYFCNRGGRDIEYNNVIQTLRFNDTEGHGITKILNIGCHPTVLDNKNMFVSNDFFGVIRYYLQSQDGIPIMIANGEAGDVSTRQTKKAGDWPETLRIGQGIAKQIVDENAPKALKLSKLDITEVPYSVDYDATKDDYLAAKKKELEEQYKHVDPESREGLLISKCFLVDVNEKLDMGHIHYDMSSFVYDFGDFRIVTFPSEIDTQLTKRLRTKDDKPTYVIAYSNGFYYYAVNKDEYGSNHESFNSRFPYGGADEFVSKILDAYK